MFRDASRTSAPPKEAKARTLGDEGQEKALQLQRADYPRMGRVDFGIYAVSVPQRARRVSLDRLVVVPVRDNPSHHPAMPEYCLTAFPYDDGSRRR